MAKLRALSRRAYNRQLASQLETIAPVLADPHWGAESDPTLFADTEWHLNANGAKVRSRILGHSLQNLLPQP